jgi:hypothetical protein
MVRIIDVARRGSALPDWYVASPLDGTLEAVGTGAFETVFPVGVFDIARRIRTLAFWLIFCPCNLARVARPAGTIPATQEIGIGDVAFGTPAHTICHVKFPVNFALVPIVAAALKASALRVRNVAGRGMTFGSWRGSLPRDGASEARGASAFRARCPICVFYVAWRWIAVARGNRAAEFHLSLVAIVAKATIALLCVEVRMWNWIAWCWFALPSDSWAVPLQLTLESILAGTVDARHTVRVLDGARSLFAFTTGRALVPCDLAFEAVVAVAPRTVKKVGMLNSAAGGGAVADRVVTSPHHCAMITIFARTSRSWLLV